MLFDPVRPYNTLPLLPPRADLESRAVLKSCIAARAALAETRMAGELFPNQAVLINSIPLFEAQASSEIENIVTTTDRLFRFANQAEGQADPATKEALRYRTALADAAQTLELQTPFDGNRRRGLPNDPGRRSRYPFDAGHRTPQRNDQHGCLHAA